MLHFFWATLYQGCESTCEKKSEIRPKKKNVMLPSPDQNVKIGSVWIFFFFFFFTYRERVEFSNIFLKFLNGENSGGMQSKRIYKSCKCFFKPLNTNFSKFFAQIWHKKKKKKKKKKNRPCFFAFYGRSGEGNITIFFFGLIWNAWKYVLFNAFKLH